MSPSLRTRSFLLALAILALDFLTKRLVLAHVDRLYDGIPLIDGVLRFTYVRNAGAAFGIFQGGRWPFIVVGSVAVVGLSWLLMRSSSRPLRRYAYALILAGAAGNLVDRIFYGGRVVDFIEMSWHGRTFPVYNVADMGVSIGAALLVLGMLSESAPSPAPSPPSPSSAPPSDDGRRSSHP